MIVEASLAAAIAALTLAVTLDSTFTIERVLICVSAAALCYAALHAAQALRYSPFVGTVDEALERKYQAVDVALILLVAAVVVGALVIFTMII